MCCYLLKGVVFFAEKVFYLCVQRYLHLCIELSIFVCCRALYLYIERFCICVVKGFVFVCSKVFYLCVERCPFQGRASGPCPPPVEMHRICNCTEYQAPIAARGQQG